MYLFLVFLIPIALGPYFLIRNERVHKFRLEIIDNLCRPKQNINNLEDNLRRIGAIYDKWTYEQMLYSFKPLELKYWYTDEEINFINS